MPFLFEQQQKRIAPALAASFAWHLFVATVIFLLVKHSPDGQAISGLIPDNLSDRIVWLSGPGGGGGGSGNEMKEPARVAQAPGKDKITVPAKLEPTREPPKEDEPKSIEQVDIRAKSLASAVESMVGMIDTPSAPTLSQGSGTRGGAGAGNGDGIGPGTGPGYGPGFGRGAGRGYGPGTGVTLPRVLRDVKPQYTSDAMRAKVQGRVLLECVVNPDGTVGDVHVVRSLDRVFGLDDEAMKAARQWRFAPGTRLGEPVAVLVTIELTFTLR